MTLVPPPSQSLPAPNIAPPAFTLPVLTPGAYLRRRREAAGLELEDLALMLDSAPAISARARADLLAAVERDAQPVTEDLLRALLGAGVAWDDQRRPHRVPAFPFDPVVLIKLMDAFAWIQPAGCTALNPAGVMPRLCARCACSEHDPCIIGGDGECCRWVADALCSACAGDAQAGTMSVGSEMERAA